MRFLALSLAEDSRRFVRGCPPKGAQMFLSPDLEIAGLMTRAVGDDFIYQDEKVESLNIQTSFDAALISTDRWQEPRVREVACELRARERPTVLFGPLATARRRELASVADAVVVGNILNVWPELRADLERGRPRSVYHASQEPTYSVPDFERTVKPAYDPSLQCLRASLGCFCPEGVRPFCRQQLYCGSNTRTRDLDEVVGEVISLRRKHVFLLDEDIASDPVFYREFLARVWRFRHEWTVNAGERIFDDPGYIRILAKAGVRVVNLNESWLSQERLLEATRSPLALRSLRNQVRSLHRARLLAGARISLFLAPGQDFDYAATYRTIDSLSIDFLFVRTFAVPATTDAGSIPPAREYQPQHVAYQPGLIPDRHTWWKNEFYDMNAIIARSIRRPARIGFYSTLFYYYPRSFAYRQNFLEGIAYPP